MMLYATSRVTVSTAALFNHARKAFPRLRKHVCTSARVIIVTRGTGGGDKKRAGGENNLPSTAS